MESTSIKHWAEDDRPPGENDAEGPEALNNANCLAIPN